MKIKLSDKLKYIAKEYKLGDFVRNLIAVVLGIIITFVGSDWISERNTQKEVEKSIQLVKSELILNRETLKEMGSRVVFEQNAARYLFEHKNKKNEISQDSVKQYLPVIFQWSKYTFINDAMEMLKSSALLQSIDNKEIATQLIKTYTAIERAYKTATSYENNKMNRGEKLLDNNEIQVFLIEHREKNSWMETWKFLFKYPEGTTLIKSIYDTHSNPAQIYGQYLQAIDEAVAAIEKEYE